MVIWNDERPDLTSMFPAEILPEEYGGKEKPLEQLHGEYPNYDTFISSSTHYYEGKFFQQC